MGIFRFLIVKIVIFGFIGWGVYYVMFLSIKIIVRDLCMLVLKRGVLWIVGR